METFIMILLVTTSVISVAFIVERALALRWRRVIPPAVVNAARGCRNTGDLPALRQTCEAFPSPVARLLLVAANHLDCPRAENVDALQTKARHEVAGLERGLVVLEITTGIAPLLGLVGTIFGLIMLFNTMGASGPTGEQSQFANGIALALRATLMGLMVAIPSLIAWNYYNRKVDTLAVELETICDDFLRAYYHGKS